MMEKLRGGKVWKYLLAFTLPMLVVLCLNQAIDNDSYGVLANGKEIVNNGIYYTDMLSMHSDFAITVQNYSFAVVYYWIYSVFGTGGLYVMMLVLNFVIMILLYKICMLLSNKREGLSLSLMAAIDILLSFGFIVTREQMVSYVIMLALIYVLELYIRTDKAKYLAWIPLFSLIAINMRAATWIMIFLVMLTYFLDGIRKPALKLEGYRKRPIVIAAIVAFLVGFLNPYGWKMMTFIFTSYGQPEFSSHIVELNAFNPFSGYNLLYYLAMVIVLVAYIFGKKKNIRVRYLLMFFGFLLMGLTSVKSMGEWTLMAIFPLALLWRDAKFQMIDAAWARRAFVQWCGVLSAAGFVVALPAVVGQIEFEPNKNLVMAVDEIDARVDEADRGKTTVYVNYGNGGYLEYRGYKSYMDPRGEVFLKSNNGKEDVLLEYFDLGEGKLDVDEFLEKYKFDFLVIDENEIFYDLDNENYELIYDSGGETAGQRVYEKVE